MEKRKWQELFRDEFWQAQDQNETNDRSDDSMH